MNSIPFHIVDVFAGRKYAGNQLAVFPFADGLGGEEMQRIARETNFSETTFIVFSDPLAGEYVVRVFTPAYEVPFAGHPSLGTAHVAREKFQMGQGKAVCLKMQAGDIPVSFEETGDGGNILWMRQLEPVFGNTLPSGVLAEVLGLNAEDIDGRFPAQEVSTGLPFIVVPLKSLEALGRVRVSRERYYSLIGATWAKALQVFCPQTHDGSEGISTRMFADFLGIPEDPATGSGNGCLAAYFIRHGYYHSASIKVRSEQGYEIGRPSVLYLAAAKIEDAIRIRVGGHVVPVAKGEWSV